jgi:hypothetical protein
MWVLEIFRLINCSIEFSCIAPLTPVVMVMRGLVFHPLALSVVKHIARSSARWSKCIITGTFQYVQYSGI